MPPTRFAEETVPGVVPETVQADKVKQGSKKDGEIDERVVASLLQITNGNKPFTPNDSQVEKMLSLYEKGMDYTHKERTSFLPKDILQLCTYVFTAMMAVGIFIFTAFYAREYMGEVVSGFLGLVAGGLGGYGYGSSHTKKNKDE